MYLKEPIEIATVKTEVTEEEHTECHSECSALLLHMWKILDLNLGPETY
jgi:hypothetical protein